MLDLFYVKIGRWEISVKSTKFLKVGDVMVVRLKNGETISLEITEFNKDENVIEGRVLPCFEAEQV